MTAIKPIENRRVRSVPSERYPMNPVCSRPDCAEPAVDPHHIFPRSLIAGDSYFVEITDDEGKQTVIPHTTGLCRKCHDDVEQHRAWIKLDLETGVFEWHDRDGDDWTLVGPLTPQPGAHDKVKKRKRRKFEGEARRNRTVISLKVPKDAAEDGAGVLQDALLALEEKLGFDPPRPPYYTICDALNYTLTHADATDFGGGE